MKDIKTAQLKNYHQQHPMNLNLNEFLFLVDLKHFQESGRLVSNLRYVVNNKQLQLVNTPTKEIPFTLNLFTKRELKLLTVVSSLNSSHVPALTDGEVNFFCFLNENTISKEMAKCIQDEELENEKFKKLFNL